jgi:hypothetical protein
MIFQGDHYSAETFHMRLASGARLALLIKAAMPAAAGF